MLEFSPATQYLYLIHLKDGAALKIKKGLSETTQRKNKIFFISFL